MRLPHPSMRRRAFLTCLSVALIALACAGLLAAATLVPAPPAALPFVILACVATPMAGAFELARTVAVLREPHEQLRRELARLPETPHPLGF
jgi:CHASE2 domain-containing sensor protein